MMNKLKSFYYFSSITRPWHELSSWWFSQRERLEAISSYILHVYTVDDRPWDYGYLITLLRWRLGRIRKSAETWQVNSTKRNQKQLDYAIFLLDRWSGDDGFIEVQRAVRGISWDKPYQLSSSENNHQWHKLLKEDDDRREDAKKRLFRHLDKYVEGWWF